MRKIRIQNVQKAQGMVEFALVLPVLLLVILGVFAFGHMFFAYSSIVSASREASRWGAAVGTVGTGPGALARYKDCAAIRAAAVRIGNFAGVKPASVTIDYDNGPGSANYDDCPLLGTGPEVSLGDRIVVTVTVNYQPIVPFLNLPSFPLTATSARTIIKSLQVGDAPTAVPLWPTTNITITATPAFDETEHVSIAMGQTITLKVAIVDSTGIAPTAGTLEVHDDIGNVCALPNPAMDKNGKDCTLRYYDPGTSLANGGHRKITATYNPDTAHWMPFTKVVYIDVVKAASVIKVDSPEQWRVDPTSTLNLTIASGRTTLDLPVTFHVEANPIYPGTPVVDMTGVVNVNVNGPTKCTPNFQASLYCPITNLGPGDYEIVLIYEGNASYNPATPITLRLHVNAPAPTPIPTVVDTTVPTTVVETPGVTPVVPTAGPTVLPPSCPYLSSPTITYDGTNKFFTFQINNNGAGAIDRSIDHIIVSWDDELSPNLSRIDFGGKPLITLNPVDAAPTADIPGSALDSNVKQLKNNGTTSKIMSIIFTSEFGRGDFDVIVHFDGVGNCQVEATGH